MRAFSLSMSALPATALALRPATGVFSWAAMIAAAAWMAAAALIEAQTLRMKQRLRAAASSSVRGGTRRLLTAPLTGAFAITTTACEPGGTLV